MPLMSQTESRSTETNQIIPRFDWTRDRALTIYQQPFMELVFQAQSIHRQHFNPNTVQLSTLCSIKTGACPEDCKYCAQSGHYNTGLETEKLMDVDKVLADAKAAKANGATRFCMGAAWRSPPQKEMGKLADMVRQVKELGLETCMTLGMLDQGQANTLAAAGLDYYNHNLDTSPEYYGEIITTRTYQDRLDTLQNVRNAGMKICCGGILGMGESDQDRIGLLVQLANLQPHPESVPINMLMKIKGLPLENNQDVDPFDFIRTIALARIMMPASYVRLSAGREYMHDEAQAMAFMAGANSIFYGDKLLTTANPGANHDRTLLKRLGMRPEEVTLHTEPGLEAQQKQSFYNAAAN